MTATPALRRGLLRGGQARPRRSEAVATDRLAALYRDHHAAALKAAWRITGDAHDAEDVLQTVFLRLAREGVPDGLDNPAAYLNRAAINAALDIVRARKRRNIIPFEVTRDGEGPSTTTRERHAPPASDGAPDRDAGHGAAELRDRLRIGVAALAPRVGEIFALRYFEGWSNREIATHMGTSESSIGVTLFRARKRLRDTLDVNGENATVGSDDA